MLRPLPLLLAPFLLLLPATALAQGQIAWERTVADAIAVSARTGRPLLVCVNVDGESASETFANSKYRRPEFVSLVEGFVPIVCSPIKHNDEDYDEQGRRIECPRFGLVTCGEHAATEPIAYERWFRGRRVTPRHVGVSPQDEILFDRFLDQDLSRVDRALEQHGHSDGSSPWSALFTSHHGTDRRELEQAYVGGDPQTRASLLEEAKRAITRPIDLIRLGLAEEDPKLRGLAIEGLARCAQDADLDFVLQILREEEESSGGNPWPLFEALERLSKDNKRARKILRAHRAMAYPSECIDVGAWVAWVRGEEPVAATEHDTEELRSELERLDTLLEERPRDPSLLLQLARQNLAFGRDRMKHGANPSFYLIDASHMAREAFRWGASEAKVAAVRAQAEYLLSNAVEARNQAAVALVGIEDPTGVEAAILLDVLARGGTQAIYEADGQDDDWPEVWLADAHSAYQVLAQHPLGSSQAAESHAGLLGYEGLYRQESAALEASVARFSTASELHRRFRITVQRESGLEALEAAYAQLEPEADDPAAHAWFTGYARMVLAEDLRRKGRFNDALAAYDRAIGAFEESVALEADFADSTDHYVSLALAGKAQVALDTGDIQGAVDRIVASIQRRPASAEWEDGLKRTPFQVLRAVHRSVVRYDRQDLSASLESLGSEAPEVWSKLAAEEG